MIVVYLENLHHQMYEEKLNLEREYQKKDILIKDNIKFVQALVNTLDENFESFSPREVDQENHLKIEALQEEQERLKTEANELKEKIADLDHSLTELETALKAARESKNSYSEEEDLQEKYKVYKQKILEIQETEQQHIAKNLHDSVLQNLTNTIHKIEICSKIMDVDTVRCRLEFQAILKSVRDIIQNVRGVIHELHPVYMDEIGLDAAMKKEVSRLRKSEILNVSYETLGESIELSPIVSLGILRIVSEACDNILEHARAKHVFIRVKYLEEKVVIEIKDDGVGFTINNIQNLEMNDGSEFGIFMMRERAYLLSGKLEIISEPGKGTKVIAELPIR